MTPMRRRLLRLAGGLFITALTTSCAWQPYAAARAVQAVAGAPIRLHVITPLDASLRRYRLIEIKPLENLLPREIAGPVERYLTGRLTDQLHRVSSSPSVVLQTTPAATLKPGEPAVLVVEGIIDDYETGSAAMRAADVGFNHAAVTVRFQLRDKLSGRVLGAASVTAQDGRPVGGARAAMNRLVRRVGAFVDQGYRRR